MRTFAAGAIGNVLEWYDFSIYGYFAIQIGRTFFPRQDPITQVMSAFGLFAVGYLMRPLGGLVIGYTPRQVRCSAVALGCNVTLGVVGGLTPLVATWLIHRTADEFTPAYMIMAAAAVSLLAMLLYRGEMRADPR